ncbi:MAG: hypothetical protein PV353_00375, partial [Bartonella sp.]|nr:hypothetical protein [Bartonella sp.]
SSWQSIGLKGIERVTIEGINVLQPRQKITATITFIDGTEKKVRLLCRIDTEDELDYLLHGGILQYVLRNLAV